MTSISPILYSHTKITDHNGTKTGTFPNLFWLQTCLIMSNQFVIWTMAGLQFDGKHL